MAFYVHHLNNFLFRVLVKVKHEHWKHTHLTRLTGYLFRFKLVRIMCHKITFRSKEPLCGMCNRWLTYRISLHTLIFNSHHLSKQICLPLEILWNNSIPVYWIEGICWVTFEKRQSSISTIWVVDLCLGERSYVEVTGAWKCGYMSPSLWAPAEGPACPVPIQSSFKWPSYM